VDVSEAEALSSKVGWVDKLQSSSQSSSCYFSPSRSLSSRVLQGVHPRHRNRISKHNGHSGRNHAGPVRVSLPTLRHSDDLTPSSPIQVRPIRTDHKRPRHPPTNAHFLYTATIRRPRHFRNPPHQFGKHPSHRRSISIDGAGLGSRRRTYNRLETTQAIPILERPVIGKSHTGRRA
jgi:hypothetical protein